MPSARRAITWLAIGLPALLLVLAALGALTPVVYEGLPTEPTATLVLLPIVRLCRDIAGTLAVGFVLVGGLLSPQPDARLLRAASLAGGSWLLSVLAFLILTVSELLAFPLGDALQPVVIASFITQTALGQLLALQVVCAAFVALLGWAVINRVTGGIVLAVGLIGLGATALSGHSGLHSGHNSASISLALHVAGVALWVGGLAGTLLIVGRQPRVLARFSAVALVCVIVVAESGLLNASLRVAGPAPLLTTTYGALLLAKTAALLWLVRLGWLQRKRVLTVPDELIRGRLLVRCAATELAVMGVALGLAVALTRTAAPEGNLPLAAVTQGAAASLAIGMGAFIALLSRNGRMAQRVQALPEAWAVLFVVVILITTGESWLPQILGAPIAALASALLLTLVGAALCMVIWSTRGQVAAGIAILGWIAVGLSTTNAADPLRWLSIAGGSAGILAIVLLARWQPRTSETVVVEEVSRP